MSPLEDRHAAMDDMADYAAQQQHRPAVLTLPTSDLLAEVNDGLALRVARQHTTLRDVLLVQALTARLQAATIDHAKVTTKVRLGAPDQITLNADREPAGPLWLDLQGADHA